MWNVLKEAASNWSTHNDARQGAAVAYYSVFSIGPVIVISIAIAGLLFGREAVTGQVAASIKAMIGETGAQAVQAMLAEAGRPRQGLLASALGLVAVVVAAVGVVVQLNDALNIVWEVDETKQTGIWSFVRNYVVSFAVVLALGFLLMVSLIVTTAVTAFGNYAGSHLQEWLLHLLTLVVSFAVISLLFAMMFKWLPDASIDWHDVWIGAAVTAALFEVGKFAIG
jgi:membrane protein